MPPQSEHEPVTLQFLIMQRKPSKAATASRWEPKTPIRYTLH